MTTERPGLYPYHDVNGTNATNPEDSLFLYSGYPAGLKVPSSDHNGKFRRTGFWLEYLDRNGITNSDWLDDATTAALTTDSLTYDTGENVLGAGATVLTRGVYLINGTRIETDAAFLSPVGGAVTGDKLKYPGATAPGRIWIYAGASGQPRYESVAAGVADSPEANEITLVGVDIDATGEVTDGAVEPVTLALPDLHLPVAVPVRMTYNSSDPALRIVNASGVGLKVDSGGASIAGAVALAGAVTCNSTLAVSGAVTCSSTLAVTSTSTLTGAVSCGGTLAVTGTSTLTGAVSCGSTLTVNGATSLGTTLAVGSTITASGGISLGTQTISGGAGSLVDVENIAVTELRFDDSVGSLPGSPGAIRWNGSFFSYHDQDGTIRTLEEAVRGYDATFSTALAIADTEAACSRLVHPAEPVWIEISCRFEATDVEEMAYRVQVSGPLGDATIFSGNVAIPAASVGYTFFQAFRWTPTDDYGAETDPQTYSFNVGLGIGGTPTLTATNVTIKVSSCLTI